jgi:hypothetical protein
MITWSFAEPLRNEASIEEFEANCGIQFPEAFKEIVLKHNNGYPSCNCFALSSGELGQFEHLYSFNRDDAENVWDFNSRENLDVGMIAFAVDAFGNQIAFRAEDMAIVLIDYDTDEVSDIASDFSTFLSQLTDGK